MKNSLNKKTAYVLWNHAKKYWKLLAFGLVMTLVVAAFDTVGPLYYKQFFNAITRTGPKDSALYKELFGILVVWTFIQAGRWLGGNFNSLSSGFFLPKYLKDLADTCFAYVQQHSYGFFTKNLTGSLVRKFGRFVDSAGNIYDQLFWGIFPLIPQVVGITIVTAFIRPALAVAIAVWVVFYATVIILYNNWKSKYDIAEAKINSKVSGRLSDVLTNNVSMKVNAQFGYELKEYKELTRQQAVIERISRFAYEAMDAIQSGLMSLLEIVLMFLALHYWREGTVSIGDFVLLQAYAIGLMGQLWGFGRVVRKLSESFSYSREMVEILDMPHEVRDRIGATKLKVAGGNIEFSRVTFNYNETRSILKDFSMIIPAGQKIGIVGSSGAGKSTFVSLLLRYYDVTDGKILIDSQNIVGVEQDSLRENISLIPQDVMLFHRSLKENIRYGRLTATNAEVEAAAKLAHASDFIEKIPDKYDALVGERGVRLSGGERQRIAIARAILKNAPILVLDEATSSLDSESERLIQDSLESLMHGKTTIVIAHRLSTLKRMDRIIVIENGQILEDGKPSELLEKPKSKFKHLWDLQVGGFLAV